MWLTVVGTHLEGDIALYLLFFAGQLLYILKRSAAAIRNPDTPIKNRRQYVYHNWDILLIRTAFEFPVFYLWRHESVSFLLNLLNLGNVFGTSGMGFYSSPITALVVGYAASDVLNWITNWTRLPQFLRDWLAEEIPAMPVNGHRP